MKGLLWKDWYCLRNSVLLLTIFGLLTMIVSGTLSSDKSFGCRYLLFFNAFLSMQALTAFSLDDTCNWNAYAVTMPVTRNDMVRERYLLLLLLTAGSAMLFAAVYALFGAMCGMGLRAFRELLLILWLSICINFLWSSIVMLLYFRLSSQLARVISLLCFMLPVCLATVLGDRLIFGKIEGMGEISLAAILGIGTVLAAIIGAVCCWRSCRVFERRDTVGG